MTRNPFTGKNSFIENNTALKSLSSPHWPAPEDQNHWQSVIDLIPTGMLVVCADTGNIITCNEAFEEVTGYGQEELYERSLQFLLPPEEIFQVYQDFKLFAQTGQQQRPDYSIRSKEGHHLNVLVKSSLQEMGQKRVVFIAFTKVWQGGSLRERSADLGFESTTIINSIDTYLWSMDRSLRFQQVNTAAREMFLRSFNTQVRPGVSFQEIYKNQTQLSKKIWNEQLAHVFKTGEPARFEISEVFNGRFVHIKAKIQPIADRSGRVKAVSCHVENDTQEYLRHQLMEVLDQFKTRIIGVKDCEELMWLVTDEILAKMEFQDALILQVEGNKLVAKAAHGAKRVGNRNEVSPLVLNIGEGVTGWVAHTGKSVMLDDVRKDKRYLSRHFDALSEIAVPIVINGSIVGVINCESEHLGFFTQGHLQVLKEVAELVGTKMEMLAAEKEVQKMEMLNRAVLDSTPHAFLLLDPGMKIRSFNRMAAQSLGDYQSSVVRAGQPYITYVPQVYQSDFTRAFKRALKGEIQKEERQVAHPTRGTLWLRITFAPAFQDSQNVMGVTLIIEDITKRKMAEKTVFDQNRELKKANRELDKFVYSVSHDLRAPIANVMGLSTILNEAESLEEVKEYSTMIDSTMKRMDLFIHNILDYSRNNRLEIIDKEVDLPELVEEVVQDYKHIDGVKNIRMTLCLEHGFSIHSDRQRISIILNNLVSNAVKYHDPAKPNPFIRICAEKEGKNLRLRVWDNGQGIEEKHLPNLFKMFYTANLRAQGSGIGLYILKDAVSQLGGEINVRSRAGQETEFTILLPCLKEGKDAHTID